MSAFSAPLADSATGAAQPQSLSAAALCFTQIFNCGSPMRACRLYHIERLFVKCFRHIVTGKAAAVSDSRLWVNHLILLYTAFLLSAVNGCCGYCAAADKQQGNPKSKIAVIAGLRILIGCSRFGTGRFFLKSSNRIFDSLCHLVYFRLLRNIFATDNSFDSGFHTGEILVVILLQSICFFIKRYTIRRGIRPDAVCYLAIHNCANPGDISRLCTADLSGGNETILNIHTGLILIKIRTQNTTHS